MDLRKHRRCRVRATYCGKPLRCRRSKQLEVVEVVAVLHDMPFNLASHSPSDEVLHPASDEEGWIGACFDANSDVALLDHLHGGLDCDEGCQHSSGNIHYKLKGYVLVGAIRNRVITTGSLRRAKAETVTFFSTCFSLAVGATAG